MRKVRRALEPMVHPQVPVITQDRLMRRAAVLSGRDESRPRHWVEPVGTADGRVVARRRRTPDGPVGCSQRSNSDDRDPALLSSEEHSPQLLVDFARMAEDVGLRSVLISDHYHPWIEDQGQSGFVRAVIGAISERTGLRVTTGVTGPIVPIHPAVLAQAAATAQILLAGRFAFGVGSGEALNEHILGDRWPPVHVRHEMLDEALQVIRSLWLGGVLNHHGRHYTV